MTLPFHRGSEYSNVEDGDNDHQDDAEVEMRESSLHLHGLSTSQQHPPDNNSSGHLTLSPTPFKNTMALSNHSFSSSSSPFYPGARINNPSSNNNSSNNNLSSPTYTRRNSQPTTSLSTPTPDDKPSTSVIPDQTLFQAPTPPSLPSTATATDRNTSGNLLPAFCTTSSTPEKGLAVSPAPVVVRSRHRSKKHDHSHSSHHKKKKKKKQGTPSKEDDGTFWAGKNKELLSCCDHNPLCRGLKLVGTCACCPTVLVQGTWTIMNIAARILFWVSAMASVGAVGWYSYELKKHGTDPHLIAWFSAGAFVLLGFPLSMYGIVMHLAHYHQPNVQMYVVRILWMVPIYSIESWLCLRYKDYAIYIETLRDCYESYVLYSFLQFLIQVLGGEEALILMLKDKSPTRGVHMWGLQWCVKPWLMGQPLRKTYERPAVVGNSTVAAVATQTTGSSNKNSNSNNNATLKRVYWTSPFFVKCKFGVLQYVLLKFLCSIAVMLLERYHIYKEGNFTWKGGYLYICILTNLSQCWALYCLIFFYYATKNELSSIRPVGKFLSVKALVFFTWWQSVGISMLYQMDVFKHYHGGTGTGLGLALRGTGGAPDDDGFMTLHQDPVPLTAEEALQLDQLGGAVLSNDIYHHFTASSDLTATVQEWSPEDVAKGLQDYLICIEMFVAAIVHIFVFPHTEYDPKAVEARNRALNQQPHKHWNKRLGRKWKEWDNKSGWSGTTNTSHEVSVCDMAVTTGSSFDDDDDLRVHPMDRFHTQTQPPRQQHSAFYHVHDEEDDEENNDDLERKPLLLEPILSEEGDPNEESRTSMHSLASSALHGGSDEKSDDEDGSSDDNCSCASSESLDEENPTTSATAARKTGFVKALLESAIPQDLRDNTVGIIKGDYVVEKKTLLHHAATSDSYDLFSRTRRKVSAAMKPILKESGLGKP